MEDTLTINIYDLMDKINELLAENVEYVELTILEQDEFEGNIIPKSLNFGALDGQGGITDFEDIEHQEISSTYKWD